MIYFIAMTSTFDSECYCTKKYWRYQSLLGIKRLGETDTE